MNRPTPEYPQHNALTLHHEYRVLPKQSAIADGIQVAYDDRREIEASCRGSDVVFTQLRLHNQVARSAAPHRRPFARFVRMGRGLNRARNHGRPALIAHNAHWRCGRYPHPSHRSLLHSPVYVDDIRSIYNQTHLLRCPSHYEPHPRTPLESCASGIPTIAHPAPGTIEAIGDAGIYCDRDDPDAWVEAIKRPDDPEEYAGASSAALARSGEKKPGAELRELETILLQMFGRPLGPRDTQPASRP